MAFVRPKIFNQDRGFTLLELVFAVLILTIALLALLPLLYVGTMNSLKAQIKAEATTIASDYIEQVRQMDYQVVGNYGAGDPAGDLYPYQFTHRGMEVTITPVVSWVDDPGIDGTTDYKQLDLTVTVYSPNIGETYNFTTSTFIRRDNFAGTLIPPTIDFSISSPSAGDIVYGSSVNVGARAETTLANGFISNMRFYVDGTFLRNSFDAGAEWSPGTAVANESFSWDTTYIDEDGNPTSPDGSRILKVEAWDSVGQQVYTTRQIIVDNYPPNTPTKVRGYASTDVRTNIYWDRAYDGTDIADHYYVSVWRQNPSGMDLSSWEPVVTNVRTNSNSYALTSSPGQRYYAQVTAASPRDLLSSSAGMESPYLPVISKPILTGVTNITIPNKNTARISTKLTMTQLYFPHSYHEFTVYRSESATQTGVPIYTTTGHDLYVDAGYTDVVDQYIDNKTNTKPLYYRVLWRVVPGGYAGGTTNTLWTDQRGGTPVTNKAQANYILPRNAW